jgi:hypothetical protein
MCVGRHDLPENAIIDAKIFVTKTVADALDLAPGFGWKIGEPVVGNTTYGFRYGLDCVGGGAGATASLRNSCKVFWAAISCKTAISAKQSWIAIVGSFVITRL